MKTIFYSVIFLLVSGLISAQTIIFNVQEVKAKDFSQKKMEEAYETCCAGMKPNKGGFALQVLGKGADNGMTHRFVWYWEMGEDLWEGTNVQEKAPLWRAQMDNYVEVYGESYSGRVLSNHQGTNEDYKWVHIWDYKVKNQKQFKEAHDKIVNKYKKEFEGRWVAFGTYDVNSPGGGATHWVGLSGKNLQDHIMLYDKLQKQTEFLELLKKRGGERVRDYMFRDLKTY